jgi:hypothetical protein
MGKQQVFAEAAAVFLFAGADLDRLARGLQFSMGMGIRRGGR